MRRLLVLVPIALVCWPGQAGAQQVAPPRVTFGGQAGGLVVLGDDGGFRLVVGPRLAVRVAGQWAVELLGEIFVPSDSDALYGLYQILLSHPLRDRGPGRSKLLVTFGAVGPFEYDHDPERREVRPDGSTLVRHPHTTASLGRPILAAAGIGFHRVVSPRAAVRSDVQVMFGREPGLVLRATVGVSVPIGGRYATTR